MHLDSTFLDDKISAAGKTLESCTLCGNRCKVNRIAGEKGICNAPLEIVISSFTAHHGEEPVFSGIKGSGAIFFSYCSLSCIFCQNYEISQNHLGYKVSKEELADIMINLQRKGCHNINLVSPTHFMPQILESIKIAKLNGLNIPILYNSNGYDSIELLEILDGVIDIYMPDFKYFDDNKAFKYSKAKGYVQTAKDVIKEMFRQVGVLSLRLNSPNAILRDNRTAKKGILVRNLVLPNNISDSKIILDFLSAISLDIWISLMSQYSPQYKAKNYPEINSTINPNEYNEIVEYARELGFNNLLIQEIESNKVYLPDFGKKEPFG